MRVLIWSFMVGLLVLVTSVGAFAQGTLLYEQDFTGAHGTNPAGFATSGYGYILSRIYENQYEQRKTEVHPDPTADDDTRAAGYFNDGDMYTTGPWRDTTVETLIHSSGHLGTDPGLLVRARGICRGSGNLFMGQAYHVRIAGDDTNAATKLELLHYSNDDTGNDVADPNPHFMASDVGEAFDPTVDRLLRVQTTNIPNPEHDHVHIVATLFNGATEETGVLRTIDFTHNSVAAITGGGGAGYRTVISSTTINPPDHPRGTFDDLKVYGNNDSLLWHDDYYDNRGLKMSSFSVGGLEDNLSQGQKYHFRGTGLGEGGTLINHSSWTGQNDWEDVEVSAIMRMGLDVSELYSGLAVRAQNIDFETGAGDLYVFNLTGPNSTDSAKAGLYRVHDGAETLLAEADVSAGLTGVNIFMKCATVTDGDGNVNLEAVASLNSDYSDPIASLSFLDGSVDKLTGPGTAGYIVRNGSEGQFASNFDSFTVEKYGTALLPGDLNDDGFVGGDDLDIVRSFWGQTVEQGNFSKGDPSNDGFVGGDDLDIVRANWGQGTPPAPNTVPEPSVLALLLAGSAMGMMLHRRTNKG